MAADKEFGPCTRIAHLIRVLVETPRHHTKKALAELYGVSADAIKGDFTLFRTVSTQWNYLVELFILLLHHFRREKQSIHRQILIHRLPMDAGAFADESPLFTLGRRGSGQSGEPRVGYSNLTAVFQVHKKFMCLYTNRDGLWYLNLQSVHSNR